MVRITEALQGRRIVKAKDLKRHAGHQVSVAGMLITGKITHTRHGDPMEFLTFEDETGLVETTFFPRAYRRFCYMLDRTRPYILSGKVDEDFGDVFLEMRDSSKSFAMKRTRPFKLPILRCALASGNTSRRTTGLFPRAMITCFPFMAAWISFDNWVLASCMFTRKVSIACRGIKT